MANSKQNFPPEPAEADDFDKAKAADGGDACVY